jgi:hypothetical protein
VNGLFLRERTKTSRNVTISFSQSPERATATRGRVQLVVYKYSEAGIVTQLFGFVSVVMNLKAGNILTASALLVTMHKLEQRGRIRPCRV